LKATTHDQQQWVILQPVDMTAILFFLFFYFFGISIFFGSLVLLLKLDSISNEWWCLDPPPPNVMGRISMQVSLMVCFPCKRIQCLVIFTKSCYGIWCLWKKIFLELQKKYMAEWGWRSLKGLGLAMVQLFTNMHQLLIFEKIHFEGTWNYYSWSLIVTDSNTSRCMTGIAYFY
jgi:hypothetical protein